MAEIQFARGVTEDVVPDVRVTRAPDGSNGKATFVFEYPRALASESTYDITGMYMIDEEGEIATSEVEATFSNGQPTALTATYKMRNSQEWERFLRFMDRYAEENGLGLKKANDNSAS